MGLKFDPIGGGQFQAAIKAIIEAESQPIKNMQAQKAREETKLKLFNEFKQKFSGFDKTLAEFTDFRKFRELKVDLGDGKGFVEVSIDKERAVPGTYSLQVDQLAERTSVISNGFSDPSDPILGVGFVVVELSDGETAEIFVDAENASLHGIAGLINAQSKSPIQASVVKDGSDPEKPWRLILTGKKDGQDDAIHFPEFYFLDGYEDFYIADDHEARNAYIALDGFELEAQSNKIENFLQGVNLHLKQARPDAPFTISITEDYEKIAGKVKGLVDQVNGILDFINKQNQVDDKSDTRTTFTGDTSLQSVEYRLRNLLHEGFPVQDEKTGEWKHVWLNQLGVEFDKSGVLTFKQDKFQKALEDDFSAISEAITGPHGFASQLRTVIGNYTRAPDGLLSTRESGIRNRIKKIDQDIANKERRIDQRTDALVGQFSRLQSSLANMQRQGQYLQAAMPAGGGGNLVSQLLGG